MAYTAASLVILAALGGGLALLLRSRAGLCLAAFVGLTLAGALMTAAHSVTGAAMIALGVLLAFPAVAFAEPWTDDGGGGGGGAVPPPPDPADLWGRFEVDFWSHVERREPVAA